MLQYFDVYTNPIAGPSADGEYRSVEQVDGGSITVQYFKGQALVVLYDGLTSTAIQQHHSSHYPSIPYQVHAAPWTDHFAADGTLSHKVHTQYIGDDVMIEQTYSPSGELQHGTTYLMEGDDITYAAEFGADRVYFSAIDFSIGDSIPVEDLRDILDKIPFQ